MIKFFRKIRQNLLSEGKTGKYLKYAIGEIILVVIGILIALGINNWNENRKKVKIEIQYVNNLIQDIKNDQIFYESRVLVLNNFSNIHNNFISIIENGVVINESEKKLPSQYAFGAGLAYESSLIKNNPDFRNYISSPEILDQLKKVFFNYEYVDRGFSRYNELRKELGLPMDIIEYKNLKDINEVSKYEDFTKVINNQNTLGILTIMNRHNENVLNQLDKLQKDLDVLMELLIDWKSSNI
ncbi:DUF6090 family protein [Psychroserpens algicola]|uniref:DUF6090 family protein n=1 Tax=Psychroserpens algicola TaxID=1719034 RepID=A0ABT0HD35_9FLAO|nr:DUF6090 family protein [Psychroserpens algicola]MCK8482273.1 DUF6090 family protein [Psychroserpens algicola]